MQLNVYAVNFEWSEDFVMSSLPADYGADVGEDVDMKPFTTNLHVSFINVVNLFIENCNQGKIIYP